MPEDLTLEEAVEQYIKARDEWEEAWEQLFVRRGWDAAQQEARRRLAPTGLAFLLDEMDRAGSSFTVGSGQGRTLPDVKSGIDHLQAGDDTISDLGD